MPACTQTFVPDSEFHGGGGKGKAADAQEYRQRYPLGGRGLAELLEGVLEHDGTLTLVQVRLVGTRQTLIERVLDDELHPCSRLCLLSPVQHERPSNPLEQLAGHLLDLIPFRRGHQELDRRLFNELVFGAGVQHGVGRRFR